MYVRYCIPLIEGGAGKMYIQSQTRFFSKLASCGHTRDHLLPFYRILCLYADDVLVVRFSPGFWHHRRMYLQPPYLYNVFLNLLASVCPV